MEIETNKAKEITILSNENLDDEPKIQKKVKTDNSNISKPINNTKQIPQEVIEIEDSSEEDKQQKQTKPVQKIEPKRDLSKPISTNQNGKVEYLYKKDYHTQKCSQCKKPNSVLGCAKCQKAYHLKCVGIKEESQIPKKYYCQKCQQERDRVQKQKEKEKLKKQKEKELEEQILLFQASQQMHLQKMTKQIPLSAYLQPDRNGKSKHKRDKKQEEYNLKYEQFCSDYPQYIENRKVKFPIDDMILSLNSDLFPLQQNNNKKPNYNQFSFIDPKNLSDIMVIWNFFKTFSQNLSDINLTQQQIYMALQYQGDEPLQIVSKMHIELLNFFLDDLFEKNKIDTAKELQENSFYQLVKYLQDEDMLDQALTFTWTEFIRNLPQYQDFQDIFEAQNSIQHIELLKDYSYHNYNKLPFESKLQILISMIYCVQETESFRVIQQENQENLMEQVKEKQDLQTEVKKLDIELKQLKAEVGTQEQNFTNKQAAIQLQQVSRTESLKLYKELDKEKKELQKKKRQLEKLENDVYNKKERLDLLIFQIPFYLNNVVNMGLDAEKRQYWFFSNDDDKIYIQPNLRENQDMYVFEGENNIKQLQKALNKHGIREKQLLKQIDSLLDNKHLFYRKYIEKKRQSEQQEKQEKDNAEKEKENNKEKDNKQNNNDNNKKEGQEEKKQIVKQSEELVIELESEEELEKKLKEEKDEILSKLLQSNEKQNNFIELFSERRITRKQMKETKQIEVRDLSYKLIKDMILHTEQLFTAFLEKKKSRWDNKENRAQFRQLISDNDKLTLDNLVTALKQLNQGFAISEKLSIAEPKEEDMQIQQQLSDKKKKLVKPNRQNNSDNDDIMQDEEEEEQQNGNNNIEVEVDSSSDECMFGEDDEINESKSKQQNDDEEEIINPILDQLESNPNLKFKKIPLKIWGISGQTLKMLWQEYNIDSLVSLYFATYILCQVVGRYVEKKVQSFQGKQQQQVVQQKQSNKLMSRQKQPVGRNQKKVNYNENSYSDEEDDYENNIYDDRQEESEDQSSENVKNTRGRKKRLNKLKDLDNYKYDGNNEQMKQKQNKLNELLTLRRSDRHSRNRHSLNENQWDDQCKKCGEFGDVLCCNTCTSVFHLKCARLKEVPEGNWSCMECLNKLAQQQASSRATRSSKRNIF